MSNIHFGWSFLGTNDQNPNRSSSMFMIWIRDPKSIFGLLKITDEKLWSVSFHNHLVARYHIYNSWSSTSVNISSARLGKMGKFLIWLRTSQPSSRAHGPARAAEVGAWSGLPGGGHKHAFLPHLQPGVVGVVAGSPPDSRPGGGCPHLLTQHGHEVSENNRRAPICGHNWGWLS